MGRINQTQKCILLIATEIDRICRNHNIKYSMIGGTMIGAIRHQGFIPWDDDIDFAMLRSEYNRFIEACQLDLDDRFLVQTENNERFYAFSFAKIMLKGTRMCEEFSRNVEINHCIWVDVFPLDNLPDNIATTKYTKFFNHVLKNLIWVKCGYGEEFRKKQIKYNLMRIVSLPFTITFLKRQRYKLITGYNEKKTNRVFLSDYPHIQFYRSWFDCVEDFQFEDCHFEGITQYDQYLSKQFGNYMDLPPLEQRKAHSVIEIDYGPYKNI